MELPRPLFLPAIAARIVFCVLLATPAYLFGQTLLEGRVIDPSGSGIPGARVQFLTGNRLILSVWTDATGAYRAELPKLRSAASSGVVVVSASGFSRITNQVDWGNASSAPTFTLQVAPVNESITVPSQDSGRAAQAPPTEGVLQSLDIESGNAADVGEALSDVDGFWMKRKAGINNDVVVRGFEQGDINLLVDGARVYGACPSQMDPAAGHVDVAQVERIEFTKGPFDVRNAGSLGASVNVITRDPAERLSIEPFARFGSFGAYSAGVTGSYATRWVSVMAGFSAQAADPYHDGRGQAFTAYTNYSSIGQNAKAYDNRSGWMRATFKPAEDDRLSVSYTRLQGGLVLYPYLMMDSDYDHTDRATVSFDGQRVSAFQSLHFDGYYTNVIHVMSDSQRTSAMNGVPTMTSPTSARSAGGHLEGALPDGFTIGLESFYRNWDVSGAMVMSGMVMYSHSLPDVNTYGSGVYMTYQRAFTPRLILKAGARYDYLTSSIGLAGASTDLYYQYYGTRATSATDNYPSGNIRVSYAALPAVTFFAGVGSAGRSPDAEERFFARAGSSSMSGMGGMSGMSGMSSTMQMNGTVGDPKLLVPRNTESDLGAEVRAGRLRLTANLFYSNIQNFIMIGRTSAPSTTSGMSDMGGMSTMVPATTYNNVDARIYGGELSYNVGFGRGLSLVGGISQSIGISDPKPQAGIHNTNMAEMPPLRGTATLRYVRRYLFAEAGAVIADRQGRVDSNLLETPTGGYTVFHTKLGVNYRKFRLNFGADNLLDHFYYQNLSYTRDPFSTGIRMPEAGRSFFAEVRALF